MMGVSIRHDEAALLHRRVEELEHEVDVLQAELELQQSGVRRLPTTAASATPSHHRRRPGPEALLLAAGGVLILLGVAFFLALAIANGWLTPALQVMLAEATGLVVIAAGFALLRRPELRERVHASPPMAGAFVGLGAGIVVLGLVASALAYDAPVLPAGVALAAIAGAAALVCLAAVRTQAQWLAGFGLGVALAGPLMLDVGASSMALAFVGAGLMATTVLAVLRSWPWLGPVALVVTAPQLIAYMQDRLGPTVSPDIQPQTWALLGIALVWWLLVAYASIGCVMIRPLQRSSLPLPLGFALPAAGFAGVVILGFRADSPDFAFGDITVAALLILAFAHALLVSVFALQADRPSANGALLAAALLAAIALPIETGLPLLAALWALLAVVVVSAGQRQGGLFLVGAGLLLASITWVVGILPNAPENLLFGATSVTDLSIECVSCLAMLAALSHLLRTDPRVRLVWIVAAATAFYWLSALFISALTPETIRIAQGPDPDQAAQAALSITWALIGLGMIAFAVRDRIPALRNAGVAVLAATALKVILFDTNTLAAGLRVSAFIASGIVLVLGAWLLSHLTPSGQVEHEPPTESAEQARSHDVVP